jgi:hypothetical protein
VDNVDVEPVVVDTYCSSLVDGTGNVVLDEPINEHVTESADDHEPEWVVALKEENKMVLASIDEKVKKVDERINRMEAQLAKISRSRDKLLKDRKKLCKERIEKEHDLEEKLNELIRLSKTNR